MTPRAGLPPPMGFPGFVWTTLAAPATTAVLLLVIAAGAIVSLLAEPGQSAVTGPLVQVPVAFLPFAVWARAAGQGRIAGTIRALWALGLALAAGGAVFAGGQSGIALIDGGAVEHYTRIAAGLPVDVHLGGVLRSVENGGVLELELAVKRARMGSTSIPLDGSTEGRLGPWAVRVHRVEDGDVPTGLRFRLRPRDADGQPIELMLRQGRQQTLDDGTRVAVEALSADYGRALGPAARLSVEWGEQETSGWHFVNQPDLDARVGRSPWIVEPMAVVASPRITLDVRRAGDHTIAMAGWALMILALVASVAMRSDDGGVA